MSDTKNTETKKSKKSAIIIAIVFVVVFVAASLGYVALSQQMAMDNAKINPSNGANPSSQNVSSANATTDQKDSAASSSDTANSQKAPNFAVLNTDGQEVTLSDFLGKPIVLNFWASPCGPCQMEMPGFQAAYEQYGQDVQFVMVNFTKFNGESVDRAKEYLAQNNYTFPVYYDIDISAAAAYGVSSVPRTFLIDAEGYIVAGAAGAVSEQALVDGIEQMLL